MCRSLAHLHALGICHRDIKPQNLLVDTRSHVLKLCDFGSSKALQAGEPSVAYICSRYYRAPELIFGATDYTCAIDMWSAGCVFAELLLGHPMFPGETGVDQLVEIIKIMGTPTREQVVAMNRNYTEFHFPIVKAYSWTKASAPEGRAAKGWRACKAEGSMQRKLRCGASLVILLPASRSIARLDQHRCSRPATVSVCLQLFKGRATDAAIDLIAAMLTYEPHKRVTAAGALTHPFFDELRAPGARLPDGEALPPLFNFTEEELALFAPDTLDLLIPPHARTPANWKRSPRAGLADGLAGGAAAAGAGARGSSLTAPASGAGAGSSLTSRESRTSDLTLSSPTAAALTSALPGAASKGAVGGRHPNTTATASESTHSLSGVTPRHSTATAAPTARGGV